MTLRPRDYFLYHLTYNEFEDLVTTICKKWLGEGVGRFADGKDGGRDARFNGKAECYPSTAGPWSGKIVIQAKHTKTPDASCSDSDFQANFKDADKGECPKIARLMHEELLTHYMVFTNRKLTGGADEKTVKAIKSLGMDDAVVVGLEDIDQFLHQHPVVARELPSRGYARPFEFDAKDMVEVITGMGDAIPDTGSAFESALDLELVNKKRVKNKVNNMSPSYYQTVVVDGFMALFPAMKSFLENERNSKYRGIYHDIADELRQKMILFRDQFDYFEEILVYIYDEVRAARPELAGRRRYITFLLCYMYFDCDIGEREPVA